MHTYIIHKYIHICYQLQTGWGTGDTNTLLVSLPIVNGAGINVSQFQSLLPMFYYYMPVTMGEFLLQKIFVPLHVHLFCTS